MDVKKKLASDQIHFLKHILDNHDGLGWSLSIIRMLKHGIYIQDRGGLEIALSCILNDWTTMVSPHYCNGEHARKLIKAFGKPTRYLSE